MMKIKIYLLLLNFSCCFYSIAQNNKPIHELNFQFTNQYRNNLLEPTWPIYEQNYRDDPVEASLPRLDEFGNGKILISRTKQGLLFSPEKEYSVKTYKVFPRIQAPCVMSKLEVTEYSKSHTVKLGFAKDAGNYALLSKVKNKVEDIFSFELIQEGKEPVRKTFNGIKTNEKPYKLYFFLGNNDFRFMIETSDGLQHIGILSEKRTCFTIKNGFSGFSPSIGMELKNEEYVTIGAFSSGYFEGIGHADIRSVTYENGDPIRNEKGNFYISTSSRFMGKNGGSGGICVYEMDGNGRIVRPVSLIVAQNNEWIEAGTAAKLVYDREKKEWLYVARAFPSPGGMLHIGKTEENLISDGLHLISCENYKGIVENSLDGDLIKIEDTWYIAYHGGRPRKLHVAKSEDLMKWEEINATDTGEGISITKMDGEYFIIDASSPTQMNVRKMFNPSKIVGSIELDPTPGNYRKHGGFPWGCIIPVIEGRSTRYLMVCFSMDEYIDNDSVGIFTYGDIFSYKSISRSQGNKYE